MPIIALPLPIHLRNRHPLATGGLERDIPNASVLNANYDCPILKHGEMNPIAGLEVRSSPYVLGDRRLALTGHCGKRHLCSPILTIRNIVSASTLLVHWNFSSIGANCRAFMIGSCVDGGN
jgi:hypothetical protein